MRKGEGECFEIMTKYFAVFRVIDISDYNRI